MTTLTRTIAGVSVLAGFALLLQINPWHVALALLSLLAFVILLSLLWAIVITYNWYNMERNDKRNKNQ